MPIVENIRAIRARVRQEAQECRRIDLQLGQLYEDIAAQEAVGAPLTSAQLVARRNALAVANLVAARAAADSAWSATEEIPGQDELA